MSIAVIHRNIERGIGRFNVEFWGLFFIIGDSCSLSEDLYICLVCGEDVGDKNIISYIYCFGAHLGAK